jgi:hypothetical protein
VRGSAATSTTAIRVRMTAGYHKAFRAEHDRGDSHPKGKHFPRLRKERSVEAGEPLLEPAESLPNSSKKLDFRFRSWAAAAACGLHPSRLGKGMLGASIGLAPFQGGQPFDFSGASGQGKLGTAGERRSGGSDRWVP